MKRILVAYVTKNKNSGINKYVYNFANVIQNNYKDIKFDFLTSDSDAEFKEFIEGRYGKLFVIPSLRKPIKRYKEIKKIIRQNNYDIVYINISEAFNICTALAAKKTGIKKIVIHSHSSGPSGNNFIIKSARILINLLFKKLICNCGSVFLACSRKAGLWMFNNKIVNSNKYHTINNTIDISKYKYDADIRRKYRDKYKIKENDIVIGNIGNFSPAKNQIFLLKILEKLEKKDNFKVMLVGSGKLKQEFNEYIKRKKIEDKVIFTGSIDNVNQVIQAMDIFAFPSVVEGFGIAALEAQAAGVYTILSENVPDDVIVSNNTIKLPLDEKKWISYIMQIKENPIKNVCLMDRIYEFDNSNIKQYKYIVGGNTDE
ncbi:MAG: glycosyltransferase family 1 protein [Clostridiales bacterium]|nr:glycosyltransferase family 1 protein [Clostridiales bacterium]